jgi:hypothetical protein
MLKNLVFAGALSAAILTTGAANAVIYDTGLDGNGPPTNGAVDAHWTVAQVGGSILDNFGKLGFLSAYIATVPSPITFPFDYWAHPLGTSNWIVPTRNGPSVTLDPRRDGFYLYTQLFTVNPGTTVTGQFLADNDVTNISLFDLNTLTLSTIYNGSGEGNFVTPTSFSLGSLTGDNYILSFLVDNFKQNGGNPSGLDVSFSSAVPEPSTWAMMILGFMGVGFMAYRRKNQPALRIV